MQVITTLDTQFWGLSAVTVMGGALAAGAAAFAVAAIMDRRAMRRSLDRAERPLDRAPVKRDLGRAA